MTMVYYHVWAAAVLAWQYDTVHAGPVPPDDCPSGVRTLETQDTQILTVTPVLVSTHCPYDMDLVIAHANTIHCTNAPTDISTVITITKTGPIMTSSLENGPSVKPTETGETLGLNPGSIQAESSGASGQGSQTHGGDNRHSMPSGLATNASGHGNTANHGSNPGGPGVSSESTSLETGSVHAETFVETTQAASQTENSQSERPQSTSSETGGSQKATFQLTNTPTETATEETQTIASGTETPPSMSSQTEASATETCPISSSQAAQTATPSGASTSPSESLSSFLSSAPITALTTATPSAAVTTSTKTSSTCSPAEPTKICATGLPRACKDLSNLSGIKLDILQDAAECTSALGAFEKEVSPCFAVGPFDLLSPWDKVVHCLQDQIGSICLPQLPDACASLAGLKGVKLAPDTIALCAFQLGPFADGKARRCLKSFVNGADIVTCLRGSLGLGLSACAAAGAACVSALAPECTLLGNVSGFDLRPGV